MRRLSDRTVKMNEIMNSLKPHIKDIKFFMEDANDHVCRVQLSDSSVFYGKSSLTSEAKEAAYTQAYTYAVNKGIIKYNANESLNLNKDNHLADSLSCAAQQFATRIRKNSIIQYFDYEHLPEHLKAVSKPLCDLANQFDDSLPDSPEKTVVLIKLLEAKDCFVRAALDHKDLKLNTGNISDGYHTFDQLYFDRMSLFSVICNTYADKSWKSKQHHDETMFDGYFIVGIETPMGHFTYHYKLEFWDCFNVTVLDKAPEWDGHTAKHIYRLLTLIDPSKNEVKSNGE